MSHNFVIYSCDFKTGKREPAAFLFDTDISKAQRAASRLESELPAVERKNIAYVAKPTPRGMFEVYIAEHNLKLCPGCRKYKKATTEFFYAERFHKQNLTPYCKPCHLKKSAEWKERNRARVQANRQRTNDSYSKAAEMAGLTHRGFRALPREERLAWLAKARSS